ncbi:MAG: hypothetical protein ACM3JI_02545, partial [Anaerolineae bacterium]
MIKFFRFLILSIVISMTAQVFADTIESGDEFDDRDLQALREWINTKRQVTVKEKGGALAI